MFFTARTPVLKHAEADGAPLVYVGLWSCCLCLSPEVWFPPHRAYAITLCSEWEESEYKLLPFWLYACFSAGKHHRIDKVMKIQEVNWEVTNSFSCVLWHLCPTVSVGHGSGHWCMRSEEPCCNGSRLYSLLSPRFPQRLLLLKKSIEAVRQA